MRKSLGEQLLEISNSASGWNEGEDPESFDAFNNNHGAESGGSDVSDDDEGEMGDGINSAKQHYLQVGYEQDEGMHTSILLLVVLSASFFKLALFSKSRLKSNLGIDMQEANSAYIGKRVSRKDFYDEKQQSDMEVDDDDDEEEDEDVIFEQDDEEGGDGVHDFDSDDYQVLNPNANSSQQGNEDDDDEEEVEEKSDDQDDSDFDAREQKLVEKQMFQLQEQEKQLVQSMSQDSKSDIEKGRHVRNQMVIFMRHDPFV